MQEPELKIQEYAQFVHQRAKEKGFWEDGMEDCTALVMIHAEISEVVEALRVGDGASEKLGESFSHVEEELADAMIRIMEYSAFKGFDLEGAIKAKVAYNQTRPHKHGKLF